MLVCGHRVVILVVMVVLMVAVVSLACGCDVAR